MEINKNLTIVKMGSLGHSASECLKEKTTGVLEIIFTKGKLELEVEDIQRINIYEKSMNIILKDKRRIFVNLENITQME